MNTIFYALTGSLIVAGWARTALALSVVHLFKSTLVPTNQTTKAALTAAEADYEGYTAKTITNWSLPGYAAVGGSSIDSGYQQFDYVDAPPHTGNGIGGFWVEDAAGNVIIVGTFATPVQMNVNGNICPVEAVLNFGS